MWIFLAICDDQEGRLDGSGFTGVTINLGRQLFNLGMGSFQGLHSIVWGCLTANQITIDVDHPWEVFHSSHAWEVLHIHVVPCIT